MVLPRGVGGGKDAIFAALGSKVAPEESSMGRKTQTLLCCGSGEGGKVMAEAVLVGDGVREDGTDSPDVLTLCAAQY